MNRNEKYLWGLTWNKKDLPILVYLNEKGEIIYGNKVTDSNLINPFHFKDAQCLGMAKTHINTFGKHVGLTDIKPSEYQKMMINNPTNMLTIK